MDFIKTRSKPLTWVRTSDVNVVWIPEPGAVRFTLRGDLETAWVVDSEYQKSFLYKFGIYLPDTEVNP